MPRTRLTTAAAALIGILATMLVTFTAPAGATFADRDCGDFPSQAAAQNFFLANGGPSRDPHGLDANSDGVACESNPCPCIGRGNPQQPSNTNNDNNDNNNPGPRIYRETGNVTRVIDGDTIKVRLRGGARVSVRLLGINTPERGKCGAKDANANMRKLAPVGSTVHLVSDRTQAATDRYGRLLRYVKRQGGYNDLSFRQAWNGYTKPYIFGGKPVARHRQYVRAINNARDNARGAWRGCW